MKTKSIFSTLNLLTLVVAIGITGCSPTKPKAPQGQAPILSAIHTFSAPIPAAPEAVQTEVTLVKKEILNRIFLYGYDLQYSAIRDSGYDLTLQSLAQGHLLTYFRILNDRVQLLADQSLSFESDVNHPERLIHEFPLVSQTADTVTLKIERGAKTLLPMGEEKNSWIRSVEYVPQGNYLLIESSLEQKDGSVLQFMESLFPRDTLVPADYKPLLNDPSREELASRFRFLSLMPIFQDSEDEGRIQTQPAMRYLLTEGKTIDWYVTPNVPDTYLPQIKTAIEGWNRYSKAMWGKDFIRFAGKLPAGVKLGDPRYNVINWDNVAQAGAAYEMQAADPITGIQSHSLIYLPLAWINIGREYWEAGQASDAQEIAMNHLRETLQKRTFFGVPAQLNCLQNAMDLISIDAKWNPDRFSRELLKGVLFHEVGHALGLDHNFKASLSYDEHDAKSIFSTSIMDYNQYTIERAAFESVESDNGPLLEYDRQALSALYNNSKDIKPTDAVLPACNDAEADSVDGGVDPLCIRYDAGKEPTQFVTDTLALVTTSTAQVGATQSLPLALGTLVRDVLADPTTVTTVEEATFRIASLLKTASGLVDFYFITGAQSLRVGTMLNLKTLSVFQNGILPTGYAEAQMRTRVYDTLTQIAQMEELPTASLDALRKLLADATAWLHAIPGIPDELVQQLELPLQKLEPYTQVKTLTVLRAKVLGALARVPSAPFYFQAGATPSESIDYEALTLALLEKGLSTELKSGKRVFAEKAYYSRAILTYGDTLEGMAAIARVKGKLESDLSRVRNAQEREEIRALLKLLSTPATALNTLRR